MGCITKLFCFAGPYIAVCSSTVLCATPSRFGCPVADVQVLMPVHLNSAWPSESNVCVHTVSIGLIEADVESALVPFRTGPMST